jgi:hypothetical protein
MEWWETFKALWIVNKGMDYFIIPTEALILDYQVVDEDKCTFLKVTQLMNLNIYKFKFTYIYIY